MICSTFAAKQPLTMEQKFGAEITGGQERYVNLLLDSRGDRHLGYSSRHTQVPDPATTPLIISPGL